MATVRQRIDHLESRRDAKLNVYELTDAELLVRMGLPADATEVQIEAHFAKRGIVLITQPATLPGALNRLLNDPV